jgi:hypothetical protein
VSVLLPEDFGAIVGNPDRVVVRVNQQDCAEVTWPIDTRKGRVTFPTPGGCKGVFEFGPHNFTFELREGSKPAARIVPNYRYEIVASPKLVYGPLATPAPTVTKSKAFRFPWKSLNVDDHAVTIYYAFDDSNSWNILPKSVDGDPHVIPFSIFAPLSYKGEHSMKVYTSNGFESSEPITVDIQDIFEEVRSTVKGYLPSGTSPNAIIESGLAKIGSILPNAAKVSYSFDDTNIWSDEISYPISMKSLPIAGNLASYITPGDHKITYQFVDNLNNIGKADYYYYVNTAPNVKLTSSQLTLNEAGGRVELPLKVFDEDGNALTLNYVQQFGTRLFA